MENHSAKRYAGFTHSTPSREPSAFTLIELLVVIGIIAVLASLILPVANRVKHSGQVVQCTNNMRQIYSGVELYLQDHHNTMMQRYYYGGNTSSYFDLILPYFQAGSTRYSPVAKNLFTCPAQAINSFPSQPGYGMNWYYDNTNVTLVKYPAETVMFAESQGEGQGSNRADGRYTSDDIGAIDTTRHDGEANYLFFDGHIRFMFYKDTLQPLNLWGIDYGNHNMDTPNSRQTVGTPGDDTNGSNQPGGSGG